MPTETLTVNIVADSSQFDAALSDISRQLQGLSSQTDRLSSSAQRLSRSFNVAPAISGLEGLSRSLAGILNQIQQIAGTPLTINVAPALQSIAGVSRALNELAAQMAALSMVGGSLGGLPDSFPLGGGMTGGMTGGGIGDMMSEGGIQRFADGGLVQGPPGIDRVPALLTTGEFVLSEATVRRLGLDALHRLEQPARQTVQNALPSPVHSSSNTTIGELNVHVRQSVDVPSLVRTLHHQDAQLRNRRG